VVKRKEKIDAQLSLFESNEPLPEIPVFDSNLPKEPSVVDFVRASTSAG
jgi:hypothetical protein